MTPKYTLWDNLTQHFLSVQWLIAILVDLTAIYPRSPVFAIPHAIGDFYIRTYNDPLARAVGLPGGFYRSLVWLEIAIQVPLTLFVTYRYRSRRHGETTTQLALLVYGVQVATATYACLYEMFSFDEVIVSWSQKLTLAGFFAPYVVLPSCFAFTAIRRIVCNVREKDRQLVRTAKLARAEVKHLTFLVTGANSGIGFGILEQLIDQLDVALSLGVIKLTLVATVRSQAKAKDVERRLSSQLQKYGQSLVLDFEYIDLSDMGSIAKGCRNLKTRGYRFDAVILNAGMADFDHLSLRLALHQGVTQGPMAALTVPEYIVQKIGTRTGDGLGLTFQANFFGHYCMLKMLQVGSVVWMTSLEAKAEALDLSDVQALGHRFGYQSSKQLINVMYRHELDRPRQERPPMRLVHPGFCATNIVAAILPSVFSPMWEGMFDVLQLFGYRHHVASAYNGAFAAAEAALDLACSSSSKRGASTTEVHDCGREDRLYGSAISPLGWIYSMDEGGVPIDMASDTLLPTAKEMEALRDYWVDRLAG